MGIRFNCPACGKKMNVKSFLAGKRGVCPQCHTKFDIPGESGALLTADDDEVETMVPPGGTMTTSADLPKAAAGAVRAPIAATVQPVTTAHAASSPAAQTVSQPNVGMVPLGQPQVAAIPAAGMPVLVQPGVPHAITAQPVLAQPVVAQVAGAFTAPMLPADPFAEAPQAAWYVRPPAGGQYGPAKAELMKQWIAERRVTPDSLVWREGWADWKRADATFSGLATALAQPSMPQYAAMPAQPMYAAPAVAGAAPMYRAAPVAATPVIGAAPNVTAVPVAMGHSPVGVEPVISPTSAVPSMRATTARAIQKRRSSSTQAIALVVLILLVLTLLPVLIWVLNK